MLRSWRRVFTLCPLVARRSCSTLDSFRVVRTAQGFLETVENFNSPDDPSIRQLFEHLDSNQDILPQISNKHIRFQGLCLLGASQLHQGKFEDAKKTFSSLLTEFPRQHYSYAGMADYYISQNQPHEALKYVLRVVELEPEYSRMRMHLARIMQEQFDQFELSASHTLECWKGALAYKYGVNLLQEIKEDSTFGMSSEIDFQPEEMLMNCNTLLYKLPNRYEERRGLYRDCMTDEEEVRPTIKLSDDYDNLGVSIPVEDGGAFLNEQFISAAISPDASFSEWETPFAQTREEALEVMIRFSELLHKARRVTVLLGSKETENNTSFLMKLPFNFRANNVSQWNTITNLLTDGWWRYKPPLQVKDMPFPSYWKVYCEAEFLDKTTRITSPVYYAHSLLREAACGQCGHTVNGLFAAVQAWHTEESNHRCQSCGSPSFYEPQMGSYSTQKEWAELPLLERIASDIWKSDAVLVLGEPQGRHPWTDLIQMVAMREIPIGFFSSSKPRGLPLATTFSIHTPLRPSLDHLLKECAHRKNSGYSRKG